MHTVVIRFKRNAARAIGDARLREATDAVNGKLISDRAAAVAEYSRNGDFDALRERGRHIRDQSVHDMPALLERFEEQARAAGTTVLWAADGSSANRMIVEIARRHEVRLAVKTKSMVSEETGLNAALEAAGVETVESDLGEFILQLAGEPPSHIIVPAMHKRRADVAACFAGRVETEGDDIPALARAARTHLRRKFPAADLGITGANFLIADTGSTLIVTNEGNGRMATTLPKVLVTLAGIDKIIPRLSDLPDLLALLTRSATGQRLSNYLSISTGAGARPGEAGPVHAYVVLLDNGRSRVRAGDCREMLRCIRCGACMNHCPVYHTVGGHSYGSVYMGPMGQVLTPLLKGLEAAPELPHAATMCGACAVVCPVKIPLPGLLRTLREQQVKQKLRPLRERLFMSLWGCAARHPRLYTAAAFLAAKLLQLYGGRDKVIRRLPLVSGWFAGRDLAAPSGRPFRSLRRELGL